MNADFFLEVQILAPVQMKAGIPCFLVLQRDREGDWTRDIKAEARGGCACACVVSGNDLRIWMGTSDSLPFSALP